MLLITKLVALGIVIWFYMTADKHGEPPVKWAVIGLVGYLLCWFLVDLIIDSSLSGANPKRGGSSFVAGQVPAIVGLIAAVFIRKKLLSNIGKSS